MFSFKRKSPSRVQNVSKHPKSRTTLDKLPELCLLSIFAGLPVENLFQIGQILPHWESLIPVVGKRKRSLQIALPLRYPGGTAEQNLSFSEIFPNLHALRIEFSDDFEKDPSRTNIIASIEKWINSGTLSSTLVSLELISVKRDGSRDDHSSMHYRPFVGRLNRVPAGLRHRRPRPVHQEYLYNRLLEVISQKLPSLERLILSGLSLDGFTEFSHLSNLIHFTYLPKSYTDGPSLEQLVRQLTQANMDDGLKNLQTITLDFNFDHKDQILQDSWNDLNLYSSIHLLPENIASKFTKLYFLSSLSTEELRKLCVKFTSLRTAILFFSSQTESYKTVLERLKALAPLYCLKELELCIPEYSQELKKSKWNIHEIQEQTRNIVPLPSVTKLTIRLFKSQLDNLIEPRLFPRLCPNVLQLTVHCKGEISYITQVESNDKKSAYERYFSQFEREMERAAQQPDEEENSRRLEKAKLSQRKQIFWYFVANFAGRCRRLERIKLKVDETFKTKFPEIPECWIDTFKVNLERPFRMNDVTRYVHKVPEKFIPWQYRTFFDLPYNEFPERDNQNQNFCGTIYDRMVNRSMAGRWHDSDIKWTPSSTNNWMMTCTLWLSDSSSSSSSSDSDAPYIPVVRRISKKKFVRRKLQSDVSD